MMDRDTRQVGLGLAGGLSLGAALMYFMDPARGKRRRRAVRDRVVHAGHVAADSFESSARDVRNRTRGVVAAAKARVTRDNADDAVLCERVRSKMGRAVRQPSAIDVEAHDGVVTLAGHVSAEEHDRLLSAVSNVRGVRSVEDELDVRAHDGTDADNGMYPRGSGNGRAGDGWSPAARLLSGVAGSALAMYGARRRDAVGSALGLAGLALVTRGATNRSARRLAGVGAGRRAVDVHKTITIHAPVKRIFDYFAAWENWPQWMTHVREVRRVGTPDSYRTHWVVDAIGGTTVSWDAVTTRFEPNRFLSWRSVEGSTVDHEGSIRFTPTADGSTTVDVRMSYNPPAGVIGHGVAALFGRDPKHQMDDDLARLKAVIESDRAARAPGAGAAATRTETRGEARADA